MSVDIESIKRKLLIKYPTFGSIIANLEFQPSKDLDTTATNGKVCYYNPDFLNRVSKEQQVFLFAHEMCHIAFKHIERSEGKDKELWNVATDSVINSLLQQDGLSMIDGGVDIPEAKNHTSEEMYDMLMQRKKEQQENSENNQGQENSENNQGQRNSENNQGQKDSENSQEQGDSGNNQGQKDSENNQGQENSENNQGQGDSGNSQGQKDSENNQEQGNSENNQGQKDSENNQGQGNSENSQGQKDSENNQEQGNSENSQGQKDSENNQGQGNSENSQEQKNPGKVGHHSHELWDKAIEDKKKEEKESKGSKEKQQEQQELEKEKSEFEEKGEQEVFKENKQERRKRLQELSKELAREASEGAGSGKSIGGKRLDDIGIAKPLIDWRRLLRQSIRYDEEWSRKNARERNGYFRHRIVQNPIPETEIVLDVSGSVSEALLKNFLRECKNIIDNSKVKVGCFDTEFHEFTELKRPEDIDNMEFPIGGGTDFDAAVGAFSRRATNKIVFTDGYARMPKESPRNVIWVVYGEHKINPKGGKVINITGEQLEKLYRQQYIKEDTNER